MTLKPELSGELRSMVREVLREAMAGKNQLAAVESVRIATDAALAAFVSRLMDQSVQERVKAGKLRLTLGAAPAAEAILTSDVTEKTVDKYAATGALFLAADAVLTPLARDKARQLGLKIERRH